MTMAVSTTRELVAGGSETLVVIAATHRCMGMGMRNICSSEQLKDGVRGSRKDESCALGLRHVFVWGCKYGISYFWSAAQCVELITAMEAVERDEVGHHPIFWYFYHCSVLPLHHDALARKPTLHRLQSN